jgi:hypothetical protein
MRLGGARAFASAGGCLSRDCCDAKHECEGIADPVPQFSPSRQRDAHSIGTTQAKARIAPLTHDATMRHGATAMRQFCFAAARFSRS